jgi:hypothetical protein
MPSGRRSRPFTRGLGGGAPRETTRGYEGRAQSAGSNPCIPKCIFAQGGWAPREKLRWSPSRQRPSYFLVSYGALLPRPPVRAGCAPLPLGMACRGLLGGEGRGDTKDVPPSRPTWSRPGPTRTFCSRLAHPPKYTQCSNRATCSSHDRVFRQWSVAAVGWD